MDNESNAPADIINIFTKMEFEEKSNSKPEVVEENDRFFIAEGYKKFLSTAILNKHKEYNSFHKVYEAAKKAQLKWKSLDALSRADVLHRIWNTLQDNSDVFIKYKNFSESEFSLFIEYFDFYCDLSLTVGELRNSKSIGVVLILLSDEIPLFILSSVISAALGAGCSVIIQSSEHRLWFLLVLSEIFTKAGLPDNLFNVITTSIGNDEISPNTVDKIICCGDYLAAQNMYLNTSFSSFSFLCPRNTTAIILESCDLTAAIDSIFFKSWTSDLNFLAVSTVVVQESIYYKFLEELQFRMKQMEKNCKNSCDLKDRIKQLPLKSAKADAAMENILYFESEWGPTIILHHQDQDIEFDAPCIRVLTCRTAKESWALINNSTYSLGASVWTEFSSQALEVASKLDCGNIWINCHGVVKANVPLHPSKRSGNLVFGGSDGIFEYISFRLEDLVEGDETKKNKPIIDKLDSYSEKLFVLKTIQSADNAFQIWNLKNDKRKYIKMIADACEKESEFSDKFSVINYYAHANVLNFTEKNYNQEFFIVQKKIALGVIVIFFNNSRCDTKIIISLMTPALIFGNAVILVIQEENSEVASIVKQFNKFLPKNLVNVVVGFSSTYYLASSPSVKGLWIVDESTVSLEFQKIIKEHTGKTLKDIWIVPKNVPLSQQLFQQKCLRSKVIWLSNVDQFPV